MTQLYRWLWLGRINPGGPTIPRGALVFAAHYNGMIDAATYGSQLGRCVGVVSVQWHRHVIGRWLLPGIAVQRAKDRPSGASNMAAFRAMIGLLRRGERLLFFPEGTSRLGPERLPVQPGTLLLLRALRSQHLAPPVFFAAACYHDPTRWRSAVSLGWVGPLPLPEESQSDETWVTQNLLAAQAKAYALPAPASWHLTVLGAVLALPYLPWWAVTTWLARRTADEENVIALWKFIFGLPLTAIALVVYTAIATKLGIAWGLPLASLTGGWLFWNR